MKTGEWINNSQASHVKIVNTQCEQLMLYYTLTILSVGGGMEECDGNGQKRSATSGQQSLIENTESSFFSSTVAKKNKGKIRKDSQFWPLWGGYYAFACFLSYI